MLRQSAWTGLMLTVWAVAAAAQAPQPFPRPGETRPQSSPAANGRAALSPATASAPTPAAGQSAPAVAQAAPSAIDSGAPRPDEVVFPVYPGSHFLSSYDAGRGQRYLLYGTTAGFAEIVTYYRAQLGDKGDFVFKEPPTHAFEVGRFREDTMAFPPGVTVKDWTWGGSQGYPNPKLGAQPTRYPTIIMIVPPPPAAATPARK
jgi:hypothetical protein